MALTPRGDPHGRVGEKRLHTRVRAGCFSLSHAQREGRPGHERLDAGRLQPGMEACGGVEWTIGAGVAAYAAGSPTLMAWESLETTGPTSAIDRKPLIATHGFRVA